ncbi:symmetrical bis(5'-nucleosyl)-tetraphosphatase [Aliiglaciecola sp. LCG003]|uniref:symmetrical bis(5'-nucleosyl)-tetraphosphatase n=1 Tax=Aliiglaciecola sp. LCG003 TaxID=3053655 RepID=UPI00257436CB|nr:symmetrical bis(5'-nucleosyl)-tetraphosphatase [Aliiglaciecola sp. LCG003]WJG10183.1 symmetrical bis(5'-nucleosyl)-tetraphosphatase [Aliiglaciecola sp. LCG003]
MANYIVGDIQGCLHGLQQLLQQVSFDPLKDKLWGVGDLIARGPDSLDTLLYLRSLGEAFDTVLGNHDLHFLAIQAGLKTPKKSDFLDALLQSDQVEEIVYWLRSKPLARKINKQTLICHAGLYPSWSFKKALKLSDEFSAQIQGPNWVKVLQQMYGNEPSVWRKDLQGPDRARFIANAFTRMRYLTKGGKLEFSSKGAPSKAASSIQPWFSIQNHKLKTQQRVFFGHWATLMGQTHSEQFIGLDTGFIWGNHMTLYCLETDTRHIVSNKESDKTVDTKIKLS